MKRRLFIQKSALASSVFLVPDFVRAFEMIPKEVSAFKKLVVIQLSGGNDGLNTIIPYENDLYYKSRPNLAVTKSEVLRAGNDLGFNKHLCGLKNLYDKGYLTVINNVGYPNPDRSHFRSTDIWHTASDANEYLNTGWLGRYVEEFGGKPYNGIEVDDSLSAILKGEKLNGIATKNPALLNRIMASPYFSKVLDEQTDAHLSEHNLGYLYKTMIEAKSSAKYLHEKTGTYSSKTTYPDNPFGKQLQTTAQFINSDVDTKVYYVSMGGFDTHVNQENRQKRLHETYSDALETFVRDLEKNDSFKDTLILTFSEFGRRVQQNAAKGTDHGTANNVFVVGKNLKKPGFYNEASDLVNLDRNGDLIYSVDFREVYATILDKWLAVDDEKVLNKGFSKLDFLG
ncbi:DUF1501 domain-containing protein [Dokdonia sinensis]|uniref:DUF1501 domain-containing protein n=1 Tax=Dokdonia sinensis TaxID=2479847 RepID=A0A3M0GHI4_9FLAO|nr:DUF1501 domain-containing protein [Dokdonia sinensis]RMB64150.1 DUF1501 domain-containing protein [Dokdonia sinensis]